MKSSFTKRELKTGDIIEARNGERGVVILEKDCILYEKGGLDCFEVFTEDLFVDGLQREGDIFKVYRDPEGPIGFRKLFGIEPIFRRKNDKKAMARAKELDDKYDPKKGKSSVIIFEPHFRKYIKCNIVKDLDSNDIDMHLSEAPSMTALGQLEINRTFIPVPGEENLYLLYNQSQEAWHLQNEKDRIEWLKSKNNNVESEPEPIIVIPEENIKIHSRSMLVRKNEANELVDVQPGDLEKVIRYLNKMQSKS